MRGQPQHPKTEGRRSRRGKGPGGSTSGAIFSSQRCIHLPYGVQPGLPGILGGPKAYSSSRRENWPQPWGQASHSHLVFYPQKGYMTQTELMGNRENQIQRPIGLQVLVLAGQG